MDGRHSVLFRDRYVGVRFEDYGHFGIEWEFLDPELVATEDEVNDIYRQLSERNWNGD
jgi:hypothetical protein